MRRQKLLLAEDNPDHLKLLLFNLLNARPESDVTAASCSQTLLDAARADAFDCIILDYNLHTRTANELVPELTCILPDVPIIVISASEDQRVVINALRTGVSDFIRKDEAICRGELWRRVDMAIDNNRRRIAERRRMERRLVEIKRKAETDSLTGVCNRHFAEHLLTPARARADRRTPTACVMLDIDHFKKVNDTFGHDAGDAVLKSVASILRTHAEQPDTIIRWGGEEFVILKPSCDLSDAAVWSERVRAEIEQNPVPFDAIEIPITASFGVESVHTRDIDQGVVTRADEALYHAKYSGRNRISTTAMTTALRHAQDIGITSIAGTDTAAEALRQSLHHRLGPNQIRYLDQHGRHVAGLVTDVCRRLGVVWAETETARTAALHHDIGKVGIPERLLATPRCLNQHEKRIVDLHAPFGAEITKALGFPPEVSDLIGAHHQSFKHPVENNPSKADAGPETQPPRYLINILAACDAAAAMLTSRPYSKSRGIPEVLTVLKGGSGAQFDPDVVAALSEVLNHTPAVAA